MTVAERFYAGRVEVDPRIASLEEAMGIEDGLHALLDLPSHHEGAEKTG